MPFNVRASVALIMPPALSPATPTFAVSLTPKQMTNRCIYVTEIESDHNLFYFE